MPDQPPPEDFSEAPGAQVINFPGATRLDIPAGRVLEEAAKAGLTSAVVVGWAPDGRLYIASSMADGGDCLWLLEGAKKKLLEIGFE